MDYACSSVCNGTCESCRSFADAGNTRPTPEGNERVLVLQDGRRVSIAPDAGRTPTPAKARDPAIDSELEKYRAKNPTSQPTTLNGALEKFGKKYKGRK